MHKLWANDVGANTSPLTCAHYWSTVTPVVKGEGYYNIYWGWRSPEDVREQTWRLIHAWHSFVCQIGVDCHCLATGEGLRLWARCRSQPKMPAELSDSIYRKSRILNPSCVTYLNTHANIHMITDVKSSPPPHAYIFINDFKYSLLYICLYRKSVLAKSLFYSNATAHPIMCSGRT